MTIRLNEEKVMRRFKEMLPAAVRGNDILDNLFKPFLAAIAEEITVQTMGRGDS